MDRDYNDARRSEQSPTSRFSEDLPSPPPVPPKDDAVSITASWFRSGSAPARPSISTGRQSFVSMTSSLQKPIKYGSGKNAQVELVPQPSDDPTDPLNWPQWRKELNFVSLLLIVGLVNGMKTVFVTVDVTITRTFDVSFASIAALTAVPLMLSAFTGHASLIASKLWGKRPVYLVSFVFIFIGSIWNMTTGRSFSGSMAARVFQGLGWGAFDTLVLGSIHDTFFEHERTIRASVYQMFVVATTWGSPLSGGLATNNAGTFTVQFRIINTFYILAIPLLLLGAPETAFDRSNASTAPSNSPPVSPIEQSEKSPAWPPVWLNKENVVAYLYKMKPLQYKGEFALPIILQGPRALITPTVGLIFLLSFIPFSAIWSIAVSVPLLLSSRPLRFTPTVLGTILTGPWIISTVVVAVFSAYRPYHKKFNPLINAAIISVGALLFLIGILAFGLHTHDVMARGPRIAREEIDPAVLSLLLGIAAGGLYTIDATTHPLIVRSASFTCSTMTVAQRSIADMHAGVVVLRNFVVAIFILTIPTALSTLSGLKSTVIGVGVVQLFVAGGVAAAWWFFDEPIRRADGKIMGLVDLSLFKDVESK
ncbi:MFS-type transporter [Paramyrothecium foliicola]|nr:MFS-type transporter [Paramyrothecium foliicola]